jgi:hypothetical protein
MPNKLVFHFGIHAIVCLVDREKKSELLPPSINQSIFLLTYLIWNFMQMGWLGKKAQTSTQYTHGCSHNVLSLLPLDIILQGFGAASANHKKHFPLSLSQLLSTLRIYMFWGNEHRKFIIANKASCE